MMRKIILSLALVSMSVHAGVITPVPTRGGLAANDLSNWGISSDDLTTVASPYSRTSVGGLSVTATHAPDLTVFVQNGLAFTANFAPGEIVLSTFGVDGPIDIDFASPVRGVGFNIVHENFGSFTGTLDFYGAGNVLFGSVSVNGISSAANDGSAPFLGGTSSLRDITRVNVRVNTVLGGRALAINQMSLLTTDPGDAVPEPGTIVLVPAALAGLLFLRKRS